MRHWFLLTVLLLTSGAIARGQNCSGSAPTISSGPSVMTNGSTVTFTWTTNVNASSEVTYGDSYTSSAGSYWLFQDQSVGVTSHSVVATVGSGAGTQNYWVASSCFTAGVPDPALIVKSTEGTFNPATPVTTAGTFTSLGATTFPVYDGTHNGLQAYPGYGVVLQLFTQAQVIPTGGYNWNSNGGAHFVLTGSIFSNYTITVRSHSDGGTITDGGSVTINLSSGCGGNTTLECGTVDLLLPSNIAVTGSACTANSGALDLGGGKCAYPITVTETSNDANCGGTLTCNTQVSTGYLIAQTAQEIRPGVFAGESDIPCQHEATKVADSCICNINVGDATCSGGVYFSWDGLMSLQPAAANNDWAELYGNSTWHWSNNTNDQSWFYDGCHALKVLGDYTGNAAHWKPIQQFCIHTVRDHQMLPPDQEPTSATNSFTLTGNGAPTQTAQNNCHTILPNSNGILFCATLTVPFATTNISTLVTNLAAGQQFIATDTTISFGFACHVLSADNVGKTFTVECTEANTPGNTDTWTIVRELSNLTADSGTNSTTLKCAACDMTNVAANHVVYLVSGVTTEWGGVATSPGATIASVNAGTHTITLNGSGIASLAQGSVFQIRNWVGVPGPADIFNWPDQFYDYWINSGDYISVDVINKLSSTTAGGAAPFGLAVGTDNQRELALQIHSCQRVLDLNAQIGANTALAASTVCLDPVQVATLWDAEFTQIDWIVNNAGAKIGGNGTATDTFLTGEQAFAIIKALPDALIYTPGDARGSYWIKALADYLYVNGYQYNTPSCGAIYYHEWPYQFEAPHAGFCDATPIGIMGIGSVANLWSEQSLMWPMYAWLCMKTGAAMIPATSTTYCAAFNDMFRYGSVYSIQALDGAPPGPKTIGQLGLWLVDAFQWMSPNTNVPGRQPRL
jgi:hypothetical protein